MRSFTHIQIETIKCVGAPGRNLSDSIREAVELAMHENEHVTLEANEMTYAIDPGLIIRNIRLQER